MKKLVGAVAAIALALLLFAPPAEARCWGYGYRWHCAHHYRHHHHWHAGYWWHRYPHPYWYGYPYAYYRPYYPRYSYRVF